MLQQNSVVECAFPTLMGHTRAMMNYAGFNKNMWQVMWCKAPNTATALDGITVPNWKNKDSYELLFRKPPHDMENLPTFGEIAVMKESVNISTKLDSSRRICMFLGYSEDHTQKVYRFLNLNTKKVVYSQDVQWMNTMYGNHTGIKCKYTINEDYSTDEEESEEEDPVQLNVKKTELSEEEQADVTKLNIPEKNVLPLVPKTCDKLLHITFLLGQV